VDDEDGDTIRPAEFWQEEARLAEREVRQQLVRYSVVFALLFAGVCFAMWWAGQTIHFSAARVDATVKPTWRVFGVVTDASSGEPVPFAQISDGQEGPGPHFSAQADHLGHYELLTLAEPHDVHVSALGYQAARTRIGRSWYSWMPSGDERADVALQPELTPGSIR
jgi:hypothetical protein